MGSLVTALASFLDIRQVNGAWHVRIDNLDPPREDPEAARKIPASLAAHGLMPDGPILWQSAGIEHYEQALSALAAQTFYCRCSRKSLAGLRAYPGTCRMHTQPREDAAIRLKVDTAQVHFVDEIRGTQHVDLSTDGGDFIIQRRDGLWGYNFATAIDDGRDFDRVLRGEDLFDVTAPQIYVMQQLQLTPPSYAHLPTLRFADGVKLSKQTHAPALDDSCAAQNLRDAYAYLGLPSPGAPSRSVEQWIQWGLEHFDLQRVPAQLPYYQPS